MAQGFYFERAVPPGAVSELLLARTLSENFSMSLEQRRISPRIGLSMVTVLKGDAPYEQGYHV